MFHHYKIAEWKQLHWVWLLNYIIGTFTMHDNIVNWHCYIIKPLHEHIALLAFALVIRICLLLFLIPLWTRWFFVDIVGVHLRQAMSLSLLQTFMWVNKVPEAIWLQACVNVIGVATCVQCISTCVDGYCILLFGYNYSN